MTLASSTEAANLMLTAARNAAGMMPAAVPALSV